MGTVVMTTKGAPIPCLAPLRLWVVRGRSHLNQQSSSGSLALHLLVCQTEESQGQELPWYVMVLEESAAWCLPGVLQVCSPTVGLHMARLEYVGVGVMRTMPPVIVPGTDHGPVPWALGICIATF